MELRAARRAERPAVLDLLAHWYNDHQFFARYNLNDPRVSCWRLAGAHHALYWSADRF